MSDAVVGNGPLAAAGWAVAELALADPAILLSVGPEDQEHGFLGELGPETSHHSILHGKVLQRQLRAVQEGGAGEGGAGEGAEGSGGAGGKGEGAAEAGAGEDEVRPPPSSPPPR